MDLWNTYENSRTQANFAGERLYIKVRNRIDTSLSSIDYSRREVNPGEAVAMSFAPEHRYLSASNVTFEPLVSIYDVNSRNMLVMRPTMPIEREDVARAKRFVSEQKYPNIEVRLIGMQNHSRSTNGFIVGIEQLKKAVGGSLMEVDLFGDNARNIAFDTRTGLSYDLMLLNRIYKPGELLNALTEEQYGKKASKLKFV